ncbi:TolB family protein [Flagellimonas aquimarina]|nr:PD40 domain-containing protein [Allomuricauda koreensis]
MLEIKNRLVAILILSISVVSCLQSPKQKSSSALAKEQDTSIANSSLQEKKQKKGTPDLGPNFNPVVSKIAYYSYVDPKRSAAKIFVSNLDGSDAYEVSTQDSIGFHTEPKWSPNGKKIAYTNFLEEGARMMAVNIDGNGLTELATVTEDGFHMFSSWDLAGKGYYFFHWPKEGFTPDAYHAIDEKVERLTNNGRTNRPQMTKGGKLYVNRIDDLENYVATKQLFDPETKSTRSIPNLEGEFITGEHTIKAIENDSTTTFILEDLQGNDLRELGSIPYKGTMFTSIDLNLEYVVYNTSFDDGAEIHLLEVATGKIKKITKN